ncbi:hypothetical protein JOF45_001297 [Nesterenkonia lacusekhoensis]|uniref:Uncharacterized protein n=1 Tax=Nesterenkonia lacusekhoensis TaxID=150832 RepID=A0ABS4T316_9MICC|nr:hypothetical protein [Nesterenkonia lacusekhoensis]MBP2318278.1 hypothetical protein [Nesterenkonia lacusekhoensis]
MKCSSYAVAQDEVDEQQEEQDEEQEDELEEEQVDPKAISE